MKTKLRWRPSPLRTACAVGGAALLAWSFFAGTRADATGEEDLIVHEWGTFTSVFSSDGVQLHGVHRDDVDLPAFVIPRGGAWGPIRYGLRDALTAEGFHDGAASQKMETPVTYFYTSRPRTVSVDVRYPKGLFTHWYPAVAADAPAFGKPDPALAGGKLDWGNLDLVPPGLADESLRRLLPEVPKDHIWQFARETDSCYVRTQAGGTTQAEKYLFYRGLADFPSPLAASVDANLKVKVENRGQDKLEHVYVMYVPAWTVGGRFTADPFAGGAVFTHLDAVESGASRTVDLKGMPEMEKKPLLDVANELGDHLERSLASTGLFAAEARAMRRTWHASYFFTPGVRVLYFLSPRQTDEVLPLSIRPAPREVRRVMVGRLEVIDPGREREVESCLQNTAELLKSGDKGAADYYRVALLREGRFLEPILRRVGATSHAPGVAELARRSICELNDRAGGAVAILGPDRVSLPTVNEEPTRMTAAARTERARTVRAWLDKWEPYAAHSKCDITGIRDARLELRVLKFVDEEVKRGVDPAAIRLPLSLRVLPICPAGCGCGEARMTGAMPPAEHR
ncbi:MAG: hypothetical protein HYZ53_00345 [Planctomycetes bacterium]|nr:hypothetical protein [Planctomycetota bacterium]